MKTAGKKISTITRTLILAGCFLAISPVLASLSELTPPDSSYFEILASANAYTCSDYIHPSSTFALNPMYDDRYYWVNYLYCTINPNEEEKCGPDSVVCEMENHPDYWIHCLDEFIKEE